MLAALLAAGACDQSVDDGRPDLFIADSGQKGERGGDAAAVDSAPRISVKVTYKKTQSVVVYLDQATPVVFEGTKHARLSAVVSLALPGKSHDLLTADFISSDGFMPGTKSNCKGLVPLAGSLFAKGYIDMATRKLRWELSLGFPGCLYVKDLAEVLLADKT